MYGTRVSEEARNILGDGAYHAPNIECRHGIAGRIEKTFGKLDALFLNAGIADYPLGDWTEAAFDRSIDGMSLPRTSWSRRSFPCFRTV